MESVKDEIRLKIAQRRISLERSFSGECYRQCREMVETIEMTQEQIDKTRLVIFERQNEISKKSISIETRKNHIEESRRLRLPRASVVAKANSEETVKVQISLEQVSDQLELTRMSLIKELTTLLYPINYQGKYRVIRGLILPSLSVLKRCEIRDEETISAALGYLAHRIDISSRIVDLNLKLVLVPVGSKSVVKDPLSHPSLAEFPLYYKSVDRKKFVTAVQMLADTLFHFSSNRGKRPEQTTDLLEMADIWEVRKLFTRS